MKYIRYIPHKEKIIGIFPIIGFTKLRYFVILAIYPTLYGLHQYNQYYYRHTVWDKSPMVKIPQLIYTKFMRKFLQSSLRKHSAKLLIQFYFNKFNSILFQFT